MMEANYFDKVYYVTCQIPLGKVTTYGAIADYLALGSARMVGWALNKSSSHPRNIPAHRVINRKGELSGRNHFPLPTMMEELLRQEGISVKNNRVVNFKKFLWYPGEHLPDIDELLKGNKANNNSSRFSNSCLSWSSVFYNLSLGYLTRRFLFNIKVLKSSLFK